ncbi:MAG: hypothetical protein LBS04_04110 [Tannerellaceae bacterium]|jgi:hypothetical protein|nr:hypothetical protein [Tannerellaceae bacterium]
MESQWDKLCESPANDDSSRGKRLLEQCKKRDSSRKLIPVKLDSKTVFLVPDGTDIEKWRKKKVAALDKSKDID